MASLWRLQNRVPIKIIVSQCGVGVLHTSKAKAMMGSRISVDDRAAKPQRRPEVRTLVKVEAGLMRAPA